MKQLHPLTQDYEKNFSNSLSLRRWKDAWEACVVLKQKQYWEKLGETCIMALDVEWAVRVYRQLGNAGMVIALENLRYVLILSSLQAVLLT